MRRQDSFLRRLDKKANNTIRDGEGGLGNARGITKANRALSKAIVENALEELDQEEAEQLTPCIMCGNECVSITCSPECGEEAMKIDLIRFDKALEVRL